MVYFGLSSGITTGNSSSVSFSWFLNENFILNKLISFSKHKTLTILACFIKQVKTLTA